MPEVWEAASPAHNIDADTPPFLVIHGADDEGHAGRDVPQLGSLHARSGRGTWSIVELPGGHLEVPYDPQFGTAIERFLVDRMHPEQ